MNYIHQNNLQCSMGFVPKGTPFDAVKVLGKDLTAEYLENGTISECPEPVEAPAPAAPAPAAKKPSGKSRKAKKAEAEALAKADEAAQAAIDAEAVAQAESRAQDEGAEVDDPKKVFVFPKEATGDRGK